MTEAGGYGEEEEGRKEGTPVAEAILMSYVEDCEERYQDCLDACEGLSDEEYEMCVNKCKEDYKACLKEYGEEEELEEE